MKKDDNCIFCKIVNGEIPSDFLYEDNKFIAIFDKFPGAFGHVLVLPKAHMENLFELTDEVMEEILKVVKKVGLALKDTLNLEALNIIQNNGELAGQTVNHFHIHLIPRIENDTITIKWQTQNVSDDEFTKLYEKLKNVINK